MLLFLFATFVFGSAVGSFLNVVIDRTVRGESIVGRSYCEHCKATLATFDLIPIVSFLVLGGRCRYCKKRLSWQYPIVEAATALLFTFSFYFLAISGKLGTVTLFYYFLISSLSVIVFVIDLKFYLVPTTLVYGASLVVLVYNYFFLDSSRFVEYTIAGFIAAFFFLLIVVLTKGRGMGQGDIILAFFIGMVLGFRGAIVAFFLAFFLGAIVAIILVAMSKKRFGQTVPFAPFLVMGFLASLFWQERLIEWYLSMLY